MGKHRKIPISEFISDKKLKKIEMMIKNSDDVELNYDRIENLLSDDYEVKDLGTNRIVLIHKKKKFKNYVFKVAGDQHGIEANYREFYNGDLDKHLTFSFSISSNGVFVVQEKVQRMRFEDMKERKKDVREMLHKLSKKILLVDCKLSNFKNFGIRKNGDVCLLDHGDTIPLPKFQDSNIVNIDEESCVSLTCKRVNDMSSGHKHFKPCGGKLKYSKNFDSLICTKCNAVTSVNDAYREFYGDQKIKVKGSLLDLGDFDIKAWKEKVKKDMKQYCVETMSRTNKNNNEEGDNTMKTIDGANVIKIKGYWIPEPNNSIYLMSYNAVKIGSMKPTDYLKLIGIKDINKYKVTSNDILDEVSDDIKDSISSIAKEIIDYSKAKSESEVFVPYNCIQSDITIDKTIANTIREIINAEPGITCIYTNEGFSLRFRKSVNNVNNNEDKKNKPVNEDTAKHIANMVLSKALDSKKYEILIPYVDLGDLSLHTDRALINRVRELVNADAKSAGCIYNKNGFSVRIKNEYIETTENLREYEKEVHDDSVINKTSKNHDIDKMIEDMNRLDHDYKKSDTREKYPFETYVENYINNNPNSKVPNEKDYEDEPEYIKNNVFVLTKLAIDNARIIYHNKDCVIIGKYAIPIDIIDKYENEDGDYELPKKMKTLLKAHNLSPKKYKINSDNIIDNSEDNMNDSNEDYQAETISINNNESQKFYGVDNTDEEEKSDDNIITDDSSSNNIDETTFPSWDSTIWNEAVFNNIINTAVEKNKRFIDVYPTDIIQNLKNYDVVIGSDICDFNGGMTDEQIENLSSVISNVIMERYNHSIDEGLETPDIVHKYSEQGEMTVLSFEYNNYNKNTSDDYNDDVDSCDIDEEDDTVLKNDSNNNTNNIIEEDDVDLNSTELINIIKELSEKIDENNKLLKESINIYNNDMDIDNNIKESDMIPNKIIKHLDGENDFVVLKLSDLKDNILIIENDLNISKNLIAMNIKDLISKIDNPEGKDINVTGLTTNEL